MQYYVPMPPVWNENNPVIMPVVLIMQLNKLVFKKKKKKKKKNVHLPRLYVQ